MKTKFPNLQLKHQIFILCSGIVFLLFIVSFYCFRITTVKIHKNAEIRVLEEINKYRQSRGLNILYSDERITEAARDHSLKMAQGLVPLGHFHSYLRFEKISQSGLEWVAAAENVACVPRLGDPAMEVFKIWTKERGYKKNMEGDFDLTGIGIAQNQTSGEYYLTQIFVKTK
ncbi:MAG TPA: CAP domain-containing protein [Bacillota bacterium]